MTIIDTKNTEQHRIIHWNSQQRQQQYDEDTDCDDFLMHQQISSSSYNSDLEDLEQNEELLISEYHHHSYDGHNNIHDQVINKESSLFPYHLRCRHQNKKHCDSINEVFDSPPIQDNQLSLSSESFQTNLQSSSSHSLYHNPSLKISTVFKSTNSTKDSEEDHIKKKVHLSDKQTLLAIIMLNTILFILAFYSLNTLSSAIVTPIITARVLINNHKPSATMFNKYMTYRHNSPTLVANQQQESIINQLRSSPSSSSLKTPFNMINSNNIPINLLSSLLRPGEFLADKYRAAKPPKPCSGDRTNSLDHSNSSLSIFGGVCMFQYECLQLNGEPIGYCFNSYLVGTCCKLSDNLLLPTTTTLTSASTLSSLLSSRPIVPSSTNPKTTLKPFEQTKIMEILKNNQISSTTTILPYNNKTKTSNVITSHFVPNNNGQMDLEEDGELKESEPQNLKPLDSNDSEQSNENEFIQIIGDNHSSQQKFEVTRNLTVIKPFLTATVEADEAISSSTWVSQENKITPTTMVSYSSPPSSSSLSSSQPVISTIQILAALNRDVHSSSTMKPMTMTTAKLAISNSTTNNFVFPTTNSPPSNPGKQEISQTTITLTSKIANNDNPESIDLSKTTTVSVETNAHERPVSMTTLSLQSPTTIFDENIIEETDANQTNNKLRPPYPIDVWISMENTNISDFWTLPEQETQPQIAEYITSTTTNISTSTENESIAGGGITFSPNEIESFTTPQEDSLGAETIKMEIPSLATTTILPPPAVQESQKIPDPTCKDQQQFLTNSVTLHSGTIVNLASETTMGVSMQEIQKIEDQQSKTNVSATGIMEDGWILTATTIFPQVSDKTNNNTSSNPNSPTNISSSLPSPSPSSLKTTTSSSNEISTKLLSTILTTLKPFLPSSTTATTVLDTTTMPPRIPIMTTISSSNLSNKNKPSIGQKPTIDLNLSPIQPIPTGFVTVDPFNGANKTSLSSSPSNIITKLTSVWTSTMPSTSKPLIHHTSTTKRPMSSSEMLPFVCGRRQISPKGRVVGGTQSAYGEWPWMVSLRQWKKNAFLHKCGAALLNEYWVITAAHCVENVSPTDLLLRLGEYDISTDMEPHSHIERRIQIIAPHPKFDPRTFEYDLALLRFYEPIRFQKNIIPICLPEHNDTYVGRWATVTGWGRLHEDGPLPNVIQHVDVPIITNKDCESMYRRAGYIEDIPNIFVCAGLAKGTKDSCEGDSGGPLVIEDQGRWTLVGVISWGIGCALPNQPGVYTRITAFSRWINQIIAF